MGSDAQTLWIGSEGSQIIKKTGGSHCAGLTAPPHRNIRLSDETKKQEQQQRSLLMIPDAFKKIIITKDAFAPFLYNEDGVLVMSIFDFLLNNDGLEL
ncbi:MAG TPA: hypothetical protein PK909_03845 [Sphaerochaeta sp.]|jgi:hypothetical protein|nr:hypothetical protein [Spirochaetales bacterium]HPX29296.1 hypothetical protein [Sphaerochaeta sp.]HQB54586.1 hypothetical protein [Sphaerochaeta sp.]